MPGDNEARLPAQVLTGRHPLQVPRLQQRLTTYLVRFEAAAALADASRVLDAHATAIRCATGTRQSGCRSYICSELSSRLWESAFGSSRVHHGVLLLGVGHPESPAHTCCRKSVPRGELHAGPRSSLTPPLTCQGNAGVSRPGGGAARRPGAGKLPELGRPPGRRAGLPSQEPAQAAGALISERDRVNQCRHWVSSKAAACATAACTLAVQ